MRNSPFAPWTSRTLTSNPIFFKKKLKPVLTQHVKFLQAFKRILLDSVNLVFMEADLDNIGRQVGRDLSQQVVGQVQQSEMVHISEGFWMNLRDLIVDQKQALLCEKGSRIKLSFAAFFMECVRMECFVSFNT